MAQLPLILATKPTGKAGRWRISYLGALLTLIVVSACIALSLWQYRRGEQKQVMLASWEDDRSKPILFASALDQAKSGQVFVLVGRFLNEQQFLLDNQVHNGRLGYEVYTPFRLSSGLDVLLNRGWLAAPPKRDVLPDVTLPSGLVQVEARFYIRLGLPPLFGAVAEQDRWPIRLQRADLALMAALAELNLRTKGELHLLDGQVGTLNIRPPISGIQPEKHYAYAFQWASFATLALILFLVMGIRRRIRHH